MKTAYKIVLALLCAIALLSFLPWLYDIVFPSATSEPFVAYSPVSDSFVVSATSNDHTEISTVDGKGRTVLAGLSKNDRDSLLPQMYYNQLNARGELPDTIAGRSIDVPALKHSQWVFSSLPRDLNRHQPGVYPILESRPKRIDLEDPKEAFMFDGRIRFVDMATNTENAKRSKRFAKVLDARGFAYPATSASANITARKPYDEGYLLIDSNARLYHLKMQAGQPYVAAIDLADTGAVPTHAFILENPDMQHIGLVSTADGSLYAVEREGYRPVKLPIDGVNPERQRIVIMKNLFNWVVKISDKEDSRWVALDSDDYSLLGEYRTQREESMQERISRCIFPFRISFTSIDDCYAYPRLTDFSIVAVVVWLLIVLAVFGIFKLNNNKSKK